MNWEDYIIYGCCKICSKNKKKWVTLGYFEVVIFIFCFDVYEYSNDRFFKTIFRSVTGDKRKFYDVVNNEIRRDSKDKHWHMLYVPPAQAFVGFCFIVRHLSEWLFKSYFCTARSLNLLKQSFRLEATFYLQARRHSKNANMREFKIPFWWIESKYTLNLNVNI